MWSKLKDWLGTDFMDGFIKLFFGSAFGQILVFLSGPILASLYTPDDFGTYALMSSVAGLLSVVATGSYEFAIVTAKSDGDAETLSVVAMLLSVLFSLLTFVAILLMIVLAIPWGSTLLGFGWLLVPVFVLLQGVFNTSNYFLNRVQRYGAISKGRLLRSVSMVATQVSLGFAKHGLGLYIGMLVGHFVAAAFQFRLISRHIVSGVKSFSLRRAWQVAKQNYRFPLFLMPDQLLNELSVQSPVLLLQAFFSSSAVGLYALSQKFLSLPVAMVGNSIGQVFFRKAAILSEGTPELSLVTRRLFRFLFWLGVVPFSTLMVFGDAIFELFFGAEWVQSGLYAQLISPWLLFVLIGSPLSKLFTVQQRQGQSLVLNASLFCLRVAALLVGSLAFGSEAIAVGLFAAVSFFFWVFLAFYNLRLARVGVLPLAIEVVLGWGVTCAVLFMVRLMIL